MGNIENIFNLRLTYGYLETPEGIRHTFNLEDKEHPTKDERVASILAAELGTTPDDPMFNWDSTDIAIPATVACRIRDAGIQLAVSDLQKKKTHDVRGRRAQ